MGDRYILVTGANKVSIYDTVIDQAIATFPAGIEEEVRKAASEMNKLDNVAQQTLIGISDKIREMRRKGSF